ncbi:MAG: methylmalonyl-CoA mutase subunit beta [Xanthobacteraceae bacterium]
MANENDLPLAADFPPARREEWLKLVDGVLKGAPFEKRLLTRTYDGLSIQPLYDAKRDSRPLPSRPAGAGWQILQRVDHPDPAAANAEALHDLENGANGLMLVFNGAVGANGYGLLGTADDLAKALKDVRLDAGISLELQMSLSARDIATALADLIAKSGVAPEAVDIRFGFDPVGVLAVGAGNANWLDIAPRFAAEVKDLRGRGFRGPFAVADGRVVHNAGGSEAQELAYVLATAVTYLRALEAGGLTLDEARRAIFFRLSADAEQFLTIAKFRSMRKLWARIVEACGLEPSPAFISAETAWRMMTRRDPWVNMLRGTVAVFAAGIGGANAVTVLPCTNALGLPDRFARRTARNTQLILLEESNLAKVADPAAGAGGTEELTQQLCASAWALFQEIEKAGGIWPALQAGLLQKKVADVVAARNKAIAIRKDPITGVSEFPNVFEEPVSVLPMAPSVVPSDVKPAVDPLKPIRLAEPFEALRDASDRLLADTGARPKIFLANLGRLAEFNARATFAKNFFEAGGLEAVTNDGFASADGKTDLGKLTAAFKDSGAKLACLCSSDKVYPVEAVEAAKALAKAGATKIYLAGRPSEIEAALKEANVKDFIFLGCDVLGTLRAAHETLGLRP